MPSSLILPAPWGSEAPIDQAVGEAGRDCPRMSSKNDRLASAERLSPAPLAAVSSELKRKSSLTSSRNKTLVEFLEFPPGASAARSEML